MEILSSTEKAVYQSVIRDIHDTWKRPITIFKTPERIILTENPNFNFVYDDSAPNTVENYTVNSGIFYARIFYMKSDVDNATVLTAPNLGKSEFGDARLINPFNMVQIKIDESGHQFIQGAKLIEIDTEKYSVLSAGRRHGLFIPEYYTYWLQRAE